jgi:transposase
MSTEVSNSIPVATASAATALPPDATLPNDPDTLKAMIRELLDLLRSRDRELNGVRHRLDQLLRRLYGPKGETFRPDQPGLFEFLNEAEPVPPPPPAASTPTPTEPVAGTRPRKKGHGRKPLPADLRRERVEHDVPEADKVCPCCQTQRIKIGEEISEQLDYQPAKLFVWEHVRMKYACPQCAKAAAVPLPVPAVDSPTLSADVAASGSTMPSAGDSSEPSAAASESSESSTPIFAHDSFETSTAESESSTPIIAGDSSDSPTPSTNASSTPSLAGEAPTLSATAPPTPIGSSVVVVAPKPAQPIDKGLPGPGLLAFVITSKYSDHLPLHRQEAILARHGVELARSTLCGWMAASADLLRPLYKAMLADVLVSQVIQTDETRLPVQEKGCNKTKSGRLWTLVGDRQHPHTVFFYTPTKERDGPAAILKNYKGFLQADAANVFDGFYLPGEIFEVACWAHTRRHFYDARTSDPARAAEALARIGFFYDVEREAKATIEKEKLDGDRADALRLKMRQERTRPKLDEFMQWIDEQAKLVLPKSPMAQAIAYAQRQSQALRRFTEHGFLNIDNNAAERALRAGAVGRKNWMFVGSDEGGRTAAVLYSFTQTCRRHGIDPFAYLQDVLARLPKADYQQLDDLFPTGWAEAQRAKAEEPS